MPFNLLKRYSDILEIGHLNEAQRTASLMGIFRRDIEDNSNFNFRTKIIRPIKTDGVTDLQTLFDHLTKKNDRDENGKKLGSRTTFEPERSQRMHWVRHHIEERKKENIEVFSYVDRIDGKDVIRTYIYDIPNEYVVILEPQRSKTDYYLLTAYYLNEPGGKKQMDNKLKKKLPEVH